MPTEENVPVNPVEELSPVIETPTTAPTVEGLLAQMMAQLAEMHKDNQALRAEQAHLREQLEQNNLVAYGISHTNDPVIQATGGPNYARRVTLITRPVQDSPQDYKNLVSTADLRLPG